MEVDAKSSASADLPKHLIATALRNLPKIEMLSQHEKLAERVDEKDLLSLLP